MTARADLADLHGSGDLYPDLAVRGAHANRNETVIITKPTVRWPFMTSPDSKDATVSQPTAARDRSAAWLRSAMIALGVLAVTAATVSYSAQFVMVDAARKITVISALEAGIPDASALIFASLGIALALQGKRAVRARLLNLGAVATSVFMNYAAAGHGWRDLAIWIMPPVAYALASDTAIGVVRAWAIARQRQLSDALAEDEATPLAILGRVVLYALRFALAPPSTARGVRRMVLDAAPVPAAALPATDREVGAVNTSFVAPAISSSPRPVRSRRRARGTRKGATKTQRFLELVAERHGPLADFPVTDVSKVATALGPEVGLHPGSARTALKAAVTIAQNGSQS